MNSPRKVFSVTIYEKPYLVYDVPGKEHDGPNGEVKTWWLYFSAPLPDGLVPPVDSPHWVPYHVGIQRHNWTINIKQQTSTKEKWGETHFRSSTWVEMYCNGKLFYEFSTIAGDRGIAFAMAKIQYIQTMMGEHPFDFYNPETMQDRKIWWFGMPATIRLKSRPWEITIHPDYTKINKEEWWRLYRMKREKCAQSETETKAELFPDSDDDSEDFRNDYINWGEALSDQHIDWFRKEDDPGKGEPITSQN